MDGGHDILNTPVGQAEEGRAGQGVSTITSHNNTSALNEINIRAQGWGARKNNGPDVFIHNNNNAMVIPLSMRGRGRGGGRCRYH